MNYLFTAITRIANMGFLLTAFGLPNDTPIILTQEVAMAWQKTLV